MKSFFSEVKVFSSLKLFLAQVQVSTDRQGKIANQQNRKITNSAKWNKFNEFNENADYKIVGSAIDAILLWFIFMPQFEAAAFLL